MTGPSRTPPGDFDPGGDAQSSEADPLAWQRELDVAIADIDARLNNPRRRASDAPKAASQPGQAAITSEIIDEIAWRVAEQLRRDGAAPVAPAAMAAAISQTVTPPPRAVRQPQPPTAAAEPKRLPHGIAISIRIRRPFFRWPFRRRYRKQAMITFSDYRIT